MQNFEITYQDVLEIERLYIQAENNKKPLFKYKDAVFLTIFAKYWIIHAKEHFKDLGNPNSDDVVATY